MQILKKEGGMNPKGSGEGMMVKALGSHRFTDEALSPFRFRVNNINPLTTCNRHRHTDTHRTGGFHYIIRGLHISDGKIR